MCESLDFVLRDPASCQAKVILDLDYYTEGPVLDSNGNLFFTDLTGGRIWLYKDEELNVWAEGNKPNGQTILTDGDHLICDSGAGWIGRYDKEGSLIEKMAWDIGGDDVLHCPNDIAADHHGFYYTNSIRHFGTVFFIEKSGRRTVVTDGLDYPNGIALSPNGKYLMIAESYTNRILHMELDAPGIKKGEVEEFAMLPFNPQDRVTGNLPDGIAFDSAGRLWVAHYGMQVVHALSRSGDLLASYNTGIPLTSNLCFDGTDVLVTGGFDQPGPGRVSRLTVFERPYEVQK